MLKKLKKLAFSRVFIVGFLIAVQLGLILVTAIAFRRDFVFYYVGAFVLGLAFILEIVNSNQNMAYKLAWVVTILLFPAFGAAIYGIFCGNRLSFRAKEKMRFMGEVTEAALDDGECALERLKKENPTAARQAAYIRSASKCPLYEGGETKYYPSGEAMFPELLKELQKAERYIFLEYFIIGHGTMWNQIHSILCEKVRQGVDVRMIYDDIGSIMTLERDFADKLEAEGIQCRVFHRFVPVLSARQNNRDHRKICVVDGVTAFTGGINLADEYINQVPRFGYWKDSAVLLRGECAWSFTVMFLSMWDFLCGTPVSKRGDYAGYFPIPGSAAERKGGWIQPYTDTPLDNEPVGENVYLGILEAAHNYVWIATPYLIIDEQMEQALLKAVRSGVDVRIVTPGVPDKKLINEMTKSHYPNLLNGGVKIYEYTPGFLHAKAFLADDSYAALGSVNLDYRSLYLHFECGVWMYRPNCIGAVKRDFEELFADSRRITDEKPSWFRGLIRSVLKLYAPLL